jgi:hypothetical protein
MVAPFMYEEVSETRKRTSSASSFALPNLLI